VLVVDTGPLLATADRSDRVHVACRELLEGDVGPLVTTAMVIAEAAYLIDRQLGPAAEASLYAAIAAGQIEVAGPVAGDWQRIGELVTTYASMPLGGTDASVVVLAERIGATRIATLDRRHFAVVRPRHTPAFTLLPD
jgi:predicted nucleic acid-binding protein